MSLNVEFKYHVTYSTLLDYIEGGLISVQFLYCRGSSLPNDIDSPKRLTFYIHYFCFEIGAIYPK